jgi:hypothetical protein
MRTDKQSISKVKKAGKPNSLARQNVVAIKRDYLFFFLWRFLRNRFFLLCVAIL